MMLQFDRLALVLLLTNKAFANCAADAKNVQQRDYSNHSSSFPSGTNTSWITPSITGMNSINSTTTLSGYTEFSPHTQPTASSIIGPAQGPNRMTSSSASSGSAPLRASPDALASVSSIIGPGKPGQSSSLVSTVSPTTSGAGDSTTSTDTSIYFSPHLQASASSLIGPAWGPPRVTSSADGSSGGSGGQHGGPDVSGTGRQTSQAIALPDSLLPGSGSTYTVVQATTGNDGKAGMATYTTHAIPVTSGGVGQGYGSVAAYTILEESTLPNGQSTMITTILPLAAPGQASNGGQAITVGSVTLRPNPSSASDEYVLGSGTTLAAGDPAVTISGTAYSLTTNSQGQAQVITGTASAGTDGATTGSSRSQGTRGATASVAVQQTSGTSDTVLPSIGLALIVMCMAMALL